MYHNINKEIPFLNTDSQISVITLVTVFFGQDRFGKIVSRYKVWFHSGDVTGLGSGHCRLARRLSALILVLTQGLSETPAFRQPPAFLATKSSDSSCYTRGSLLTLEKVGELWSLLNSGRLMLLSTVRPGSASPASPASPRTLALPSPVS